MTKLIKIGSLGRLGQFYARAKLWPWFRIGQIVLAIAALVLAVLVYRYLFVTPQVIRTEAAQAKQDTRAANSEVKLTKGVMDAMQTREMVRERTRVIVRGNSNEIRSSAGASERVPPAVHDSFVRSIQRLRDQANSDSGSAHPVPGSGS